ncbi:unnamed protein product [Effrenium voratum]|nr:unnamed protein product [Effrenium voratum]
MTAMVANTPSEKLQIQYVRKVRGSRLLVAHIHHPIAGIPFKFHHAILDVAQWQLIHYSQSDDPQGVGLGSSDSSGSQCIVRMHNFDDYPSCWRVVWASSSQTKAQEVLGKARSQLGQGDYSFLLNIGEHFATWCVSGQPSTHAAAHAATHAAATSSAAVAHAAARAATAAGMKTLAVATASSGESTAFALKFGSFAICGATSGGASTATATSGGASTALAATSGGASTALAAGTATQPLPHRGALPLRLLAARAHPQRAHPQQRQARRVLLPPYPQLWRRRFLLPHSRPLPFRQLLPLLRVAGVCMARRRWRRGLPSEFTTTQNRL